VPAFQAELPDVRAGGLRHPQPVEREQGDQRVLGGRSEPGGDQERAELVAVQCGGMRLIIQPRAADVRGRGVLEEFFFDCIPVESGDGAQPPGHGGAGAALGFQFAGEGLDVGAAGREQGQRAEAAPGSELAQVEGAGVAGQAAVPGQEPGEREPLGVGEDRLDSGESSGRDRGGHQGTSRNSRGLRRLGRRARSQR
jgi:hypothetical protein